MLNTIENKKLEVTKNILSFIHYNDANYKSKALDSITNYAKIMHVTLKTKKINININLALISFLNADKTAEETINNLYNLMK